MIKLIAVEPKGSYQLLLRFSDGASGVYDFAPFIEANTEMTAPLRDPAFFARCFIELGALAWPNGLDFSAGSLHQRLQDEGKLQHGIKAA
ncbi:MAG: DUF2442 domain-containing protein [Xanthomonadaceae bacterium]|jgi:hypothetical protein|nr:DUF2442 domain-containing protein [Xanthomonadaceae bacterium]